MSFKLAFPRMDSLSADMGSSLTFAAPVTGRKITDSISLRTFTEVAGSPVADICLARYRSSRRIPQGKHSTGSLGSLAVAPLP